MKILFGFLIAISVLYGVLYWDYHLSKYIFEQTCSDSELVGQHIYEKSSIERKYTRTVTNDGSQSSASNVGYHYDGNIEIDKQYFDSLFDYKILDVVTLSGIGPVVLKQTRIIRRKDGALLGKAVLAVNRLGWMKRTFSFGYEKEYCAPFRLIDEKSWSTAIDMHTFLLRDTIEIK